MIPSFPKWKWKLFDYLTKSGRNAIREWQESALTSADRARLEAKLDLLKQHGPEWSTTFCPVQGGNIRKLRISSERKKLRPFLCKGPMNVEAEVTLLLGLTERDGKLDPYLKKDAIKEAEWRAGEIVKADGGRRTEHERVR